MHPTDFEFEFEFVFLVGASFVLSAHYLVWSCACRSLSVQEEKANLRCSPTRLER